MICLTEWLVWKNNPVMPTRSRPSDQPLPTVGTALKAECLVNALCLDCDHCQRLNLPGLAARDYRDVALIELPLICGS